MANEKLSLKVLNDKIEKLTNVVSKLTENFQEVKADSFPKVWSISHDGKFNDISTVGRSLMEEDIKREEITDEFDNVYVKLPPIYVYCETKDLAISLTPKTNYIALVPQAICKYKPSLINGQARSVAGVAPNFNQMSYTRSTNFAGWVKSEQLNWQTVLYLQILWLFIKGEKSTPSESYDWDEDRYTGYGDTGQGINEFLGIEQLFSGYTFFSFENWDESPLFGLFKDLDLEERKDYNACEVFGYYNNLFSALWRLRFSYAWYRGVNGLRLCKNLLGGF